jgi:hypothetical protein
MARTSQFPRSKSVKMPAPAASARATCTPAEPLETTPTFFPLRAVIYWTGLSAGTATPPMFPWQAA